jgi:hypothetical protein
VTTPATPPPLPTLTELSLNDQITDLINNSYTRGFPIMIAYVTADLKPSMSFRGSAFVFSDNEVAVWARSPEGGIVKAMANNPNVMLTYREPNPETGRSKAIINMRGRGRVGTSEADRRKVYGGMPQVERDADKDFNGVPVIVELDSIDGVVPGARLAMRR